MKSEVPSFSGAASKRCRFESMRRKSNFPEDCGISTDAAVGQASPRSAAHAAITNPSASAAVMVRLEYFIGHLYWITKSKPGSGTAYPPSINVALKHTDRRLVRI